MSQQSRATARVNRIADLGCVQIEDIEMPTLDADWPGYLESHSWGDEGEGSEVFDVTCAYCPHVRHHAEWVENSRADRWCKIEVTCAAIHTHCPDEDGYDERRAEWSMSEINLDNDLKSLELEYDSEAESGSFS